MAEEKMSYLLFPLIFSLGGTGSPIWFAPRGNKMAQNGTKWHTFAVVVPMSLRCNSLPAKALCYHGRVRQPHPVARTNAEKRGSPAITGPRWRLDSALVPSVRLIEDGPGTARRKDTEEKKMAEKKMSYLLIFIFFSPIGE